VERQILIRAERDLSGDVLATFRNIEGQDYSVRISDQDVANMIIDQAPYVRPRPSDY
jgi:hypothetical protein